MKRLAALLLALASCSGHHVDLTTQAPPTRADEPSGYETGVVVDVVDGDTIEVEIARVVEGPGAGAAEPGGTYTVRLIGIDTPESVKPGSPVECFGREAAAAAQALLAGTEVTLVKDVSETDRFDRLVRYVYLGDEMANARLVVNGYAHAYTYPPDVRHSELFATLQGQARDDRRGLWAPETCGGRG